MWVPLLLSLLVLLPGPVAATEEGDPQCVSKDEWPRFDLHGQPPRKQGGLTYCSRWRDFTCCDETQVNRARNLYSFMDMATTTKECREVWLLMQCAVCSPDVGVVNSTEVVAGFVDHRVPMCLSFCERVYERCASSQFAGDEHYAIRGCQEKDAICSELQDWGVGPQAFCELAGFRVVDNRQPPQEEEEVEGDGEAEAAAEDLLDDSQGGSVFDFEVSVESEAGGAMLCYDGEETATLKKGGKKKKKKKGGLGAEDLTSIFAVSDVGEAFDLAVRRWKRHMRKNPKVFAAQVAGTGLATGLVGFGWYRLWGAARRAMRRGRAGAPGGARAKIPDTVIRKLQQEQNSAKSK